MTLFEHKDRIVKEVIKPAFKQNGFKVSGTTFRKDEKDFIKVFNIQSSGFNLEDHVSFYLNIGFLFPVWFDLKNNPVPKNPKEYDCQFRIRTDSLTFRNQSYDFKPDTNIEEFEVLISKDVNDFVIPFFNGYKEIEDCLKLTTEFPKSWTDCRPYIGLTMIRNGNFILGDKIIDEFLPTTSPHWAEEIDSLRSILKK